MWHITREYTYQIKYFYDSTYHIHSPNNLVR